MNVLVSKLWAETLVRIGERTCAVLNESESVLIPSSFGAQRIQLASNTHTVAYESKYETDEKNSSASSFCFFFAFLLFGSQQSVTEKTRVHWRNVNTIVTDSNRRKQTPP
ncbi:PREDICTED: uncharacterized protein LOC108561120 [Nicrophorus vespilloides]|uniref:Uncharacterized protein LOC108561120 n=1 Tax=Nicrophorus vespilloides TaxID=110193 RepID=A0ABM1MIK6_NICVS|nr:PREDICTED: uncharacterized protein LOC108561120 [Nicrophorus vespilloides]